MGNEFEFCIPSYKRADNQKTLDLLQRLGVPKEWITLSVQTLADKAGTKKSNISRMESGRYNPSLDFIVKVADSLGKRVTIRLD